MIQRLGMDIPPATVSDWFKDVADLLRPLYYRIRDLVIDTDYIQADETTVPIVDNEKHRTVKGYLWQIYAVTRKLLFFHYDKGSRLKDVALGLSAHFRGALQTDGYAVYDYYEGKDGVLCLNCWAHTRRGFDRSMNNDATRSKYAIEQIGLLYEVERKAINYAIDHYDRLCRYVIDGRHRIDTNLVENGQRIVALTRKNYLFCKNHDATEDAAVMYTIMGCCKLAGVNVEAWLTYFLDHVHEYDNDYNLDIADFLPSNLVSKGLLKTSENLR